MTAPSRQDPIVDRLDVRVPSASDGEHRLRTFAHLLRHVVHPLNRTLVDLGAGHCRFSMVAERCGFAVTAVDGRIDRLPADLGSIRFVRADVRDFDPTGFGVIAILGLLYHLPLADQESLLHRCAHGPPVVVETQVHVPAMIDPAEAKPWHRILARDGYEGVDFPEGDNPMASIGNATSFWHTEESLIRLFGNAGFSSVTLVDPIFRSVYGARRFYVLSPEGKTR
ncbi:MAG: trans-aconitate 2-methyltransferase [Acetobacteraceae bacterium]